MSGRLMTGDLHTGGLMSGAFALMDFGLKLLSGGL